MKKITTLLTALLIVAASALATDYNSANLDTTDSTYGGRVLAKCFDFATGDNVLSNSLVALTYIPANSRIIGGTVAVSAMDGAQTFDMGLMGADTSGYISTTTTTADDPDLFLDGISCSNAVVDTFAMQENSDDNANYNLNTRPTYLTIKAVGTALWTTNETVSGVVYFIEN